MPQLPVVVPNGGLVHTIHDTNLLPAGTVYLHIGVSVAGLLRVQFRADDGVNIDLHLEVGTHLILGRFLRVLSTGTTATLLPATKVNVFTWNPAGT